MRHIHRRLALAALAAAALGGAAVAAPAPAPAHAPAVAPASGPVTVMDDEMSLGNPHARVTMVEYASASCPHCAAWNAEVFPAFRKKYVDSGKVRYVLREFLTPPVQVAAAGFMLARCTGRTHYFDAVDDVFRSQQTWTKDGDVHAAFLKVAQKYGLNDQQLDACVSNQKALDALQDRVERFEKQDTIEGTPTFEINGKKLGVGAVTLVQLDAAIAEAVKAAPPPGPVRHRPAAAHH